MQDVTWCISEPLSIADRLTTEYACYMHVPVLPHKRNNEVIFGLFHASIDMSDDVLDL